MDVFSKAMTTMARYVAAWQQCRVVRVNTCFNICDGGIDGGASSASVIIGEAQAL